MTIHINPQESNAPSVTKRRGATASMMPFSHHWVLVIQKPMKSGTGRVA